jgi:glycerol kinase
MRTRARAHTHTHTHTARTCDARARATARALAHAHALAARSTCRQVLSDTLALAVDLPDAKETTSRGVAVLVLESLGITLAPVGVASTTHPNANATRVYTAAKVRQDSLYKYHSLATEFTHLKSIPW